jgi:hypothetical protein
MSKTRKAKEKRRHENCEAIYTTYLRLERECEWKGWKEKKGNVKEEMQWKKCLVLLKT